MEYTLGDYQYKKHILKIVEYAFPYENFLRSYKYVKIKVNHEECEVPHGVYQDKLNEEGSEYTYSQITLYVNMDKKYPDSYIILCLLKGAAQAILYKKHYKEMTFKQSEYKEILYTLFVSAMSLGYVDESDFVEPIVNQEHISWLDSFAIPEVKGIDETQIIVSFAGQHKELLKARGYKYNFTNNTWNLFISSESAGDEYELLKNIEEAKFAINVFVCNKNKLFSSEVSSFVDKSSDLKKIKNNLNLFTKIVCHILEFPEPVILEDENVPFVIYDVKTNSVIIKKHNDTPTSIEQVLFDYQTLAHGLFHAYQRYKRDKDIFKYVEKNGVVNCSNYSKQGFEIEAWAFAQYILDILFNAPSYLLENHKTAQNKVDQRVEELFHEIDYNTIHDARRKFKFDNNKIKILIEKKIQYLKEQEDCEE